MRKLPLGFIIQEVELHRIGFWGGETNMKTPCTQVEETLNPGCFLVGLEGVYEVIILFYCFIIVTYLSLLF